MGLREGHNMPKILQHNNKYTIYSDKGKVIIISSDKELCIDFMRSLTTK